MVNGINNEKMIHIIGGAKTGYNLYKYVTSWGIDAELYYFPNEYSGKKKVGKSFEGSWQGIGSLKNDVLLFITSESAFNQLSTEDRTHFETHYYLRNKLNLPQISEEIKTLYIKEISFDEAFEFPLAIKPRESSAKKVPFKFRKINNSEELKAIENVLEHCIVQPYLSNEQYCQIAVAGYFDGNSSSLIAVEQKNHYPQGISAYVINKTQEYKVLVQNISDYLNVIDYKGFIEFEFKKNNKTNEFSIMDINPRTWGWFYYYLSGIKNFSGVVSRNESVELQIHKTWINLPRLIMANVNGNFKIPPIKDFIKQDICYEPYFER